MRVIIQRVSSAKIRVDGETIASIQSGLVLLLGIAKNDNNSGADYLIDKVSGLRIFADAQGKMNLDIRQAGGSLLIVSNFTVYGDTRKGRRPSFDLAAPPAAARAIYEYFCEKARLTGIPVQTGFFQTHMLVELQNDGPITIICESLDVS